MVNALRVADIRLQRADPEYATRAGSSNAHFLLPRPRPDFSREEYWQATLRGDESEINAIGVYSWYHLSAGQKASRLAHEQLTPEERRALARSMLADEAFALHFLEDMFAAGHVAGTWGDVSQRKGTHDYYNEHGLEVMTWAGGANTVVLMGDAHMRPEDAQRAAATVRLSLEQVLDVASGRSTGAEFPYTPQAASTPAAFDVCTNQKIELRPEALRTNRGGHAVRTRRRRSASGAESRVGPRRDATLSRRNRRVRGCGWFARCALHGQRLQRPGYQQWLHHGR